MSKRDRLFSKIRAVDSVETLLKFDKEHLWHPYTSMINPLPVYLVTKCKGVYIHLSNGRKLIDGMSSWWCTVHGYGNKRLNRAIKEQLKKMSHVMFGGITHASAVELAELLLEFLPKGIDKIFYSDSGSVAVEVALKMAVQYQKAKGNGDKNQIATIKGGYHGDTWHAMSVCDPVGGMHTLYSGRLTAQLFADKPKCGFYDSWNSDDLLSIRGLIEENHNKLAAVILEPIVQGAGGMSFYHPNYLKGVRELCSRYDLLLIADEIATGFGRSGKMFGCDWADVTPDIMCIGKALTGGMVSFAATCATDHVAATISAASPGSFMHGPTFMGNPLAAAVACESLKMLKEGDVLSKVEHIEQLLRRELSQLQNCCGVADVRVLGAIGVVEMERDVDMAQIQRLFVERGVWVRPFGKLVYVMPQYIISDKQLVKLCSAVCEVVQIVGLNNTKGQIGNSEQSEVLAQSIMLEGAILPDESIIPDEPVISQ